MSEMMQNAAREALEKRRVEKPDGYEAVLPDYSKEANEIRALMKQGMEKAGDVPEGFADAAAFMERVESVIEALGEVDPKGDMLVHVRNLHMAVTKYEKSVMHPDEVMGSPESHLQRIVELVSGMEEVIDQKKAA